MSFTDSGKFSIVHSFFCNAYYSCLGRVDDCLVREKTDTSTSRFRVFSMFSLLLDALLERGWICPGLDLGLFSFLFHSYVVKAFAFFSSIHVFRYCRARAMRAILPLSLALLAERLAL